MTTDRQKLKQQAMVHYWELRKSWGFKNVDMAVEMYIKGVEDAKAENAAKLVKLNNSLNEFVENEGWEE